MDSPPRYGKKTLVSGWNYDDSQPKDYDPYIIFPSSLLRSTYNRLGTWKENEFKTTSGEAQKLVKPHIPIRHELINILTYPATLGEHREKYWKMCGIKLPPETADNTDYNTSYQFDYIDYYPHRPSTIPRAELMKPETKFRRLLTDGNDPRRPGINTFYDDNMEYLRNRVKERPPPPYALYSE